MDIENIPKINIVWPADSGEVKLTPSEQRKPAPESFTGATFADVIQDGVAARAEMETQNARLTIYLEAVSMILRCWYRHEAVCAGISNEQWLADIEQAVRLQAHDVKRAVLVDTTAGRCLGLRYTNRSIPRARAFMDVEAPGLSMFMYKGDISVLIPSSSISAVADALVVDDKNQASDLCAKIFADYLAANDVAAGNREVLEPLQTNQHAITAMSRVLADVSDDHSEDAAVIRASLERMALRAEILRASASLAPVPARAAYVTREMRSFMSPRVARGSVTQDLHIVSPVGYPITIKVRGDAGGAK